MGLRHINTGNSFNGLIKEFPGLGVDKFNTPAKVFLLTHCHSDHLNGLKNKSFGSIVYSSETTKKLLSLDPSAKHVLPYIKGVGFNKPFIVSLDEGDITVTLIPAYHCPGASMFLIEGEYKSVIYTGDIRAETWWVDSLPKNPYLYPYTTGIKVLDTIYLDTTFGYRGEPFIEILPNNDGIKVTTLLINSYPKDDPDIQFYFVDSVSGFEESWAQVANFFDGSLHMNEGNRRRIRYLNSDNLYPEFGILLNSLISKTPSQHTGPKFHACGKFLESCELKPPKFPVKIKQCIDFNILDYVGVFCPILLSNMSEYERKYELKLIGQSEKGNKIYEFRHRKWICPSGSDELLPSEIKLLFSRHSSFSECRYFVSIFKTRDVYPCTESESSWGNGFMMSRLFGDLCQKIPIENPTIQFAYDQAKVEQYGLPPTLILSRPVKTINRWDFDQCNKEINLIDDFLTKHELTPQELLNMNNASNKNKKFHFHGQKFISKFNLSEYTQDEKKFHIARSKDMQLQKVIAGRHELQYKKMIENQQKLYFIHNNVGREIYDAGKYDKSRDGTKLGGIDDYNCDVDSNLDDYLSDSSQEYSKTISNRSHEYPSATSRAVNLGKICNVNEDESTDIEDDESDEITLQKMDGLVNSACVGPQEKYATCPLDIKRGPCLKRTNKYISLGPQFQNNSYVGSTFGSLEISFKRLFTEVDQTNDELHKKAKKSILLTISSSNISTDKIYFKSCSGINNLKIQRIANDLKEDPSLWLGIDLGSVNKSGAV